MSEPVKWAVRHEINAVSDALRRMESQMLGYRFTGENAEEVKALAERLNNLCKPDKGYLTGGAVAREMKDAA